jgi:putative Mg2+ transporter-C (MgtC) family protein
MLETYLIRIGLAVLAGAVIGFEREYRDKSAGLRTMILIAVGSALFAITSEVVGDPIKDQARISAAVVTGVGFLGAGVIIKEGLHIRGLTTAASIWLVASLGLAMGHGEFDLAGAITFGIVILHFILPPIERLVDSWHDFTKFIVTINNTDAAEEKALAVFKKADVHVVRVTRSKEQPKLRTLHVQVKTNKAKHDRLDKILAGDKGVIAFSVMGER